MLIILVAALSDNGVIGDGEDILWSLPDDEAHLKTTIAGEWLLTGRVSYESTQGADIFEDSTRTIVITRRNDYPLVNGFAANSMPAAIALAKNQCAEKLFVLGGASVYQQSLELADQLILTHVHTKIKGKARFPDWSPKKWAVTRKKEHPRDENHAFPFTIVWYSRLCAR